jgi:hypothetical protein
MDKGVIGGDGIRKLRGSGSMIEHDDAERRAGVNWSYSLLIVMWNGKAEGSHQLTLTI